MKQGIDINARCETIEKMLNTRRDELELQMINKFKSEQLLTIRLKNIFLMRFNDVLRDIVKDMKKRSHSDLKVNTEVKRLTITTQLEETWGFWLELKCTELIEKFGLEYKGSCELFKRVSENPEL